MIINQLTVRQRMTWLAHLFKACVKQHHKENIPLFARYLPSGSVVFDVGAHAGQYSKLFASLVPSGQVYAFEPGSYARSILERSIKFTGKRNVFIKPFGLGSKVDSYKLNVPIKNSGSLGFGLSFVGETKTSKRRVVSEDIDIQTIDEVAKELNLGRLDFIKADIEGFELEMLKGGKETIQRFQPALYIEVVELHLTRAGGSVSELLDFLYDLNYQQVELATGEIIPPNTVITGNLFFLPKEN